MADQEPSKRSCEKGKEAAPEAGEKGGQTEREGVFPFADCAAEADAESFFVGGAVGLDIAEVVGGEDGR